MKKESQYSITLLEVIERGYYITKQGYVFNKNNKEIKGIINSSGYRSFGIRISNKITHVRFHQLQAYTKYGNEIFNEELIRHLNSDKQDNSWENIKIGTIVENRQDIPKQDRKKYAKIASSSLQRFSKDEVISIWKDRQKGSTYKELGEKYNTNKGTLSNFFNKAEYVQEILEKEKLK